MIAQGNDFLRRQRRAHMSTTIEYRRGNDRTPGITATRGRSEFEQNDTEAVRVVAELHDWIIDRADLLLEAGGDTPQTPRAGDVIAHTIGDTIHKYEVMTVPGFGCYRFTNPSRDVYRIHTKAIGTEAA